MDCVILEPDVVLPARRESDGAAVLPGSVLRPVVDDETSVDPEPHALIRHGMEGIRLRVPWLDEACPPHGERVGVDVGRGGSRAPVEVYGRVRSHEHEMRKIALVIVLAPQAGAVSQRRHDLEAGLVGPGVAGTIARLDQETGARGDRTRYRPGA